jgi:cytoskeletal protein RodZ
MSRPSAERDAPAATPGAATKAALRLIDGGIHFLQRVRSRFAPADETDRHRDRQGQADSKHPPVTEESAPTPKPKPSFLRLALVALIFLLVGGGAGALLSYRTLSHQLAEHASVVERIQEDLDATRKEEARNVKLLDKFQRENAEYRHEARETQRETENANQRVTELEAQIEEARRAEEAKRSEDRKRAEAAAQQARRTAAAATPRSQSHTPQKTGNCAAGTAAEMAECIEKFNR